MKTVTVEQFKKFSPFWLETAEGRERFARIAAIRTEWTALDVLTGKEKRQEGKWFASFR